MSSSILALAVSVMVQDNSVPLAEALPEDLVFYGEVRNATRLREMYEQSSWGSFLATPTGQEVMGLYRQGLLDAASELGPEDDFDWAEFTEFVDKWAELLDMVAGPAVVGLQMAEGKSDGTLAVLADAGERIEEFHEFVRKWSAPEEDSEVVEKHDVEAGVEVTILESQDEPALQEFRFGASDSVFLSTVRMGDESPELFLDLAESLQESRDDAFAFRQDVEEQYQEDDEIRLFVDVPRVFREIAKEIKENEGTDLGGILAKEELGPLYVRGWWEEGLTRCLAQGLWSNKGMIARFGRAILAENPDTLSRLIPEDPQTHLSLCVGLTELFDALKDLAADQGESESFVEEIGGARIREDIFGSLDGQLTMYAGSVPEAEAFPLLTGSESSNVAFLVGVKDAAKVRELLEQLLRTTGFHAARRREEFQGFEVSSLLVFGLNLSFAVLEDALVISLSPTMLRDMMRRAGDSTLPSLGKSKKYRAACAAVKPGYSSIAYTTMRTSVEPVITMFAEVSGVADEVVERYLESIDKHFTHPWIWALGAEEDGYWFEFAETP